MTHNAPAALLALLLSAAPAVGSGGPDTPIGPNVGMTGQADQQEQPHEGSEHDAGAGDSGTGDAGEHGKGEETPDAPEPQMTSEEVKEDFAEAVAGFVEVDSGKSGAYPAKDEKLGKVWKLKLVRVRKETTAEASEGHFLACVDFKTVDGKTALDLDFHLQRTEEGSWEPERVLIHKVAGKPRFRYGKDYKILPVSQAKEKKKKKRRAR